MVSRSIWGTRSLFQFAQLCECHGAWICDANDLVLRIASRDYRYRILRHSKGLRQEPYELAIGCAFDRSRGNSNSQRPITVTGDSAPRGAGDNTYSQGNTVLIFT